MTRSRGNGEGNATTVRRYEKKLIFEQYPLASSSEEVKAVQVLLVDDYPLFRQGLRALLEANDTVEVVGEAGDGFEAVALTRKMTPDVVIMDINMPGHDGLEATRQIKEYFPKVKVIILSRYADHIYVDQALKSGALGYVHKDTVYDELLFAIDTVKKDKSYLSPIVFQPVINGYMQSTPSTHAMAVYSKLTAREKEVFKVIVKGSSRKVIAETLSISPKTVDKHRGNLMEKLNLRKEAEIVQFARLIGLMES
jgi:DNA-binding NarL/FixJ family response regulator